MRWRYFLIDRYNNKTAIGEPIGWDAFSLKIKRHAERHGTFRELQTNQFQFTGIAYELLKAEYEKYGIRGNYQMQILGRCGLLWEELYKGQVSFDSYSAKCDTYCSVSVSLEDVGPLVQFINLFNQKIDLSKPTAFDDTTQLVNYATLTQKILLPSKAILVKSAANINATPPYTAALLGDNLVENMQWGPNVQNSSGDQMNLTIVPAFPNVTTSALANTTFYDTINIISGGFLNMPPVGQVPLLDLQEFSSLKCVNSILPVHFRFKGAVHQTQTGSVQASSVGTLYLYKLPKGADPANHDSYISQFSMRLWNILGSGDAFFDVARDITVLAAPGDQLFFNIFMLATPNRISDFRIDEDPECFIELSTVSKCEPTEARLYLINETTSRVIEAITNNALSLYSEYIGRTDSQPYSFPVNGCGGLKALAMGLDIRNVKLSDGTDPRLTLSMQDIFESLSAIDNVGIGPEGDNKIRLENWQYFYQNEVVFHCRGIDSLTKTLQGNEHYSIFKCGYDKWEAEDYNGLDEFLTKREYHTSLTQVQNSLEKICKWIASGYAIEVTRRKQNDSKDWRYDNDTFVICLQKTDTGYAVEIGNIVNGANILDPATVYNFRISPERNAMRWFNIIAECYRNITPDDKLIFSSGDGNFLAQGELSGDACQLEAGTLAENASITLDSFTDIYAAWPIKQPERVVFSYPLGLEEYVTIKNNPYGLIEYVASCEQGFGWIDELDYKPEEGKATFTLIPQIPHPEKIVPPPVVPDPPPPPPADTILVRNNTATGTSYSVVINNSVIGQGYVAAGADSGFYYPALTNATVTINYPDITPQSVVLYITAPPMQPTVSANHYAEFESVTFTSNMMFIIN